MLRPIWMMAMILVAVAWACGGESGGGDEGGTTPTAAGTATASAGSGPAGKIVYRSNRDGNWEVYAINADGTDERNLTNDPATDYYPWLSPDGSQVVFVSNRDDGPHLFIMNADGSGVRRLDGTEGAVDPRWSPDGRQIAFIRGGLDVINADGSDLREVVKHAIGSTAPCTRGTFPGGWSPDSKRIVYYAAAESVETTAICSVAVDGSDIELLVSEPPAFHVEPVWSPDGRYIAFRSIREGNHDIYVLDLETDEEQRLTEDPARDIEPAWSPDGEWLAFASSRDGANTDIYIMRKDGSDVRRLNINSDIDSEPSWAP